LEALCDIRQGLVQSGERIQHLALRFRGEQELLVVLAVDVSQVRSQIAEQRYRGGTAGDKRSGFASRQHLALDEQFTVLGLETGRLEDSAHRGGVAHLEDSGDARPFFTRADHLGRGPPAKQKRESIHYDGFSAAGFPRQQIQSRMESHTQSVHHRVALDGQFHQHEPIIRIFAGLSRRRSRVAKIGLRYSLRMANIYP
jgi:hypothetical protein